MPGYVNNNLVKHVSFEFVDSVNVPGTAVSNQITKIQDFIVFYGFWDAF